MTHQYSDQWTVQHSPVSSPWQVGLDDNSLNHHSIESKGRSNVKSHLTFMELVFFAHFVGAFSPLKECLTRTCNPTHLLQDNDVVVCSLNFTSTRYIRLSYSTPISRRRTGLCLDTVFLSQFWHWMLSFLYLKSLFWQESNLHLLKAPKWGVGLDPQMCFKFMFEIRVQVCITLSPWLWGADMVNMTDTINNSIVSTLQGEEAGKIVKLTEFHWFECHFGFNFMI